MSQGDGTLGTVRESQECTYAPSQTAWHAVALLRTLWIFSSDNGGPLNAAQGAGNNFPFRGGKHTVFEGKSGRGRSSASVYPSDSWMSD